MSKNRFSFWRAASFFGGVALIAAPLIWLPEQSSNPEQKNLESLIEEVTTAQQQSQISKSPTSSETVDSSSESSISLPEPEYFPSVSEPIIEYDILHDGEINEIEVPYRHLPDDDKDDSDTNSDKENDILDHFSHLERNIDNDHIDSCPTCFASTFFREVPFTSSESVRVTFQTDWTIDSTQYFFIELNSFYSPVFSSPENFHFYDGSCNSLKDPYLSVSLIGSENLIIKPLTIDAGFQIKDNNVIEYHPPLGSHLNQISQACIENDHQKAAQILATALSELFFNTNLPKNGLPVGWAVQAKETGEHQTAFNFRSFGFLQPSYKSDFLYKVNGQDLTNEILDKIDDIQIQNSQVTTLITVSDQLGLSNRYNKILAVLSGSFGTLMAWPFTIDLLRRRFLTKKKEPRSKIILPK